LAVVGIALYRASERLVASELHWIVPARGTEWPLRVRRLELTSYLAGGLVACAGAAFDPSGPVEMLRSGALASFIAALGLLWTPRLFGGRPEKDVATESVIGRSVGWMLAATGAAVFFIAILGPGVNVTL
jgi:hypothetical protein